MKTMFGMLKVALGVAVLATLFAQLAGAQCVNMGTPKRNTSLLRQPFLTNPFTPAAFSQAASGGVEDMPNLNGDPIVGFWRVTFISEGNESVGLTDGTILDHGFAQWHSDGTEIHNNSMRPPATGNFCLGVWEKVRASEYNLNHFALSWNPDGTFQGLAQIREDVTVGHDHNSFTGTFTIDQYDDVGNLLIHLGGTLQGKRVTVQTRITDML